MTIDENEQTIDLGAINNERIPGTVTWNKTDLSGNLLYGSEWKLTPVDVDGGEPIVVTDNTGDESYDGKDQDSAVGQFKLEDLAWGEYELTETQSPPGYVLGGPLSFEIGPTSVDVNLGDIENEPHQGLTIPLTGGKSSEFYLFSGAILLIATLGFWLYRARSHKTT